MKVANFDMRLRVTIRNQVKAMSFHLFGSILILVILILLGFEQTIVVVFGVFWLLLSASTLLLHWQYVRINKGQIIDILEDQLIVSSDGGHEKKYDFGDLQKITLYKSASLDKGGLPILPVEMYHYATVTSKNGDIIIITCLMAPELELAISKIKWVAFERKKVFFAHL